MRLAAIVLLWLATAGNAFADELADAKAAGLLGERIDGYLGVVVESVPADVAALAEDINAKRRESYADIAAKRDVPVAAGGQIAGKKVIEKTPAGQYVMGADGVWRKK